MKEIKLSSRYAKALFDFALEQNVLELVKDDMGLVISVCRQNRDFRLMLNSPIIFTKKKESIITAIFSNHIQKMSYHFLLIITRKKRESLIEGIAAQFIEQYKEFKNITTAKLTTAVQLDPNVKENVIALLKEQTQGEIELIEEIKKEMIGGFVLSFKDFQYDASIRKQIKELKKEFDTNLYIRGF